MERSANHSPGEGGRGSEPSEDLTADLLRLTVALVTLVTAIALGVLR